jgi:hypothetical protein
MHGIKCPGTLTVTQKNTLIAIPGSNPNPKSGTADGLKMAVQTSQHSGKKYQSIKARNPSTG